MLRKNLFFVFVSSLLLSIISAHAQNNDKYYVAYKENGKASYYGEKMHGKVTASGEVYDMFAMTAAHRELPFNTIIKVTNLNDPDTWVTLRINDRGPFTKNRILDVSKRAALKLNMEKTGILEVEIEVLKLGDNKTIKPIAEQKKDTVKAKVADEKKIVLVDKQAKKETEKKKETVATANTDISKVPLADRFKKTGAYNVWGTTVNPAGYGLQLAAYTDISHAIKVSNEAIDLGLTEVYIQTGWANEVQSYRIIWGSWADKETATDNLMIAKKKGFLNAFARPHYVENKSKPVNKR
jgi:rare lipoprotein A